MLSVQQNVIKIDDVTESFEDKEKQLNDKEIIETINLNVEIEEGS